MVRNQRLLSNSLLCASAVCALLAACPSDARANPENGQIIGGSASISTSGATTTIQQTSSRALIRWEKFDIDQSEHVQFVQPSSNAIAVNRIMDNKASAINGRLSANGNIILINPNGIVFGASSIVDVGGLVATTSDLDDDNEFMNGGAVKFTKPGNIDAKIINNGSITVREAGLVGLVAPHVENNGVIQAHLGKVHLAGGDMHTVDFAGDGLIKVEVSLGQLNLSVTNTGTIDADGGEVIMSAAQARHIVTALVSNTGTIRANTIRDSGGTERRGSVTLSTRDMALPQEKGQGEVINTGTIQATGLTEDFSGGNITLLADTINIYAGSVVEVHALKDGGRIRIGGDYQGGGQLPPADKVYIEDQAILNASSRRRGNGGSIIVWAEDTTVFHGFAESTGGAEGGDGGLIEVSGKKFLDFSGTVDLRAVDGTNGTLLLDPTNIVISSGADQNVNGSSPYSPTGDDVTSILNVTTLQNALAVGNVIVQTRATGSQAGNITVSNALNWGSGNLLTLDAHNDIIISATITGANLTLIAGNDVQLNANVTGTGTITFQPKADHITVGLGTSAVGVFNLSVAEVGRIVNGWSNIIIGRTTATAAMDMRAMTWNDNLTVQTGTGAISVNGIQNTNANTFNIITDGNLALNLTNALTGTGALIISQASADTTIGLGDAQAGTIHLTNTEVARIRDGWASVTFGRTDGTGAINMGALNWTDALSIQSGSGEISVNGTQSMAANALTLRTDADLVLTGNLTGTGTLNIIQASTGTSLGLGNTQAGTLNLDTAEIARITNGWASLVFGRTDGTADVNVGALTWNDVLTLQSGTGSMVINGTQTMAANNLTIRTDSDPVINGNLTGTGTFLLTQSSIGTSMGLGDGQAGTVSMGSAELGRLTNGWASLVFGRVDGGGEMNVGAKSWNDVLTLRTGAGQLNINGTQTMTANNLAISTNSDLAINANLTGTGTLTITPSANAISVGVGTGQTGTLLLDDTELARIPNGWASIVIGSATATGAMNVGARSWVDPLTLRTGSGQLNINGALSMATNNLAILTDSDLALNAALTGTGTLTLAPSAVATTIGLGDGQSGTFFLSDAELNQITNGWTSLVFGLTTTTGSMNVAAKTWNDSVTLRTAAGSLNINGTQTMGANNLTITTNSNLDLGVNLTGTGVLTITGTSTATTIGIGTGQSGTLSLNDTELGFISDGWSSIVFGTTSMTGALNVGAYTWLDTVDFRTAGGALNINGAQNVGGNSLILRTNANLAINAVLTGTGTLTIVPTGNTTVALGTGQTGVLALSDVELDRITDGWSAVVLGSATSTAAMNVGARTWNDNLTLRTAAGLLSINGTQNMGANNLTILTDSSLVIGAALTGTGTLTIGQSAVATTIGVGTGQTGVLALADTELDLITNGWGSVVFGTTTATGVMNVGARTWNDNVTLQTSTGVITIAGAQSLGSNNLTIQTSGNLAINNTLSGTGTLTINQMAVATTMGVGTGQVGTLALTDAELTQIANGWGNIILGRTDGTGILNVGVRTWNDNLTLRTGSGALNINGIQTMGSNNLTLMTNSNLLIGANLVGSGILTIRASTPTIGIGVGDAQTGTLALSNLELSRMVDGWSRVVIGGTTATGNINIGTNTWVNPMHFITGGDVILNGVQTSTEASGTSLVFATVNGAFTNNAGASAIDPGGGRYLVYSVDETDDTLNGLVRPTIVTNTSFNDYEPDMVSETGNVYMYSGVVAKILTLLIDDQEKQYGGNLPTFTFTYVGGLQDGDLLNDVITSYSMTAVGSSALDNAGVTRTITGSFSTALGYAVNLINGTLTVVKAILNVTGDSDTREYGDANPGLSLTYSGFRNGDDITDIDTEATADTTATILSDVGNYAITGSGGLDDNYDFNYIDGTLAITKAVLIGTVQNSTREYGEANPTFTLNYTGFKNGENAGVIDTLAGGSTAATATSNVNSYTVNGVGGLDNNYSFSYVSGTMTVTKAMLTATAQDASRDYGDANPALSIVYTGFKNSEDSSVINVLGNASTTATALSNVNTYTITAAGASDNNYNFTYVNGTLSVNKATLTATASSDTREYGDANPALTVSYTGFKNGQNSAVIDTLATASTAATNTSNVGTYATTASGGLDSNYSFGYVDGILSITKATLIATAGNGTREYGDANPGFSVSYSGFKNSENQSVIDTLATATSAGFSADVGTYATTASDGLDSNYNFSYVDGILSITKAMLVATADSTTKLFGAANPVFTVSYTGFKNAENSSVIDTPALASSTALTSSAEGLYAITTAGALDNNYDFTYVDGALTITALPPAPLPPPAPSAPPPTQAQDNTTSLTPQQQAAVIQTTSQQPSEDNIVRVSKASPLLILQTEQGGDSLVILDDTDDYDYDITDKKKRSFLIGISSLLGRSSSVGADNEG